MKKTALLIAIPLILLLVGCSPAPTMEPEAPCYEGLPPLLEREDSFEPVVLTGINRDPVGRSVDVQVVLFPEPEVTYCYQHVYPDTSHMTPEDAYAAILAYESGVYGRNSGNGYFGAGQLNAGWLERNGYAYGDGSGGVGDSTNPNQALEDEAINLYIMQRYGSPEAARAFQIANGWY